MLSSDSSTRFPSVFSTEAESSAQKPLDQPLDQPQQSSPTAESTDQSNGQHQTPYEEENWPGHIPYQSANDGASATVISSHNFIANDGASATVISISTSNGPALSMKALQKRISSQPTERASISSSLISLTYLGASSLRETTLKFLLSSRHTMQLQFLFVALTLSRIVRLQIFVRN